MINQELININSIIGYIKERGIKEDIKKLKLCLEYNLFLLNEEMKGGLKE
jgi:hypothetical protein